MQKKSQGALIREFIVNFAAIEAVQDKLIHQCYQGKFLSTCYMNTSKARISSADLVAHVQGRYYTTLSLRKWFQFNSHIALRTGSPSSAAIRIPNGQEFIGSYEV